MQEFEEAGNKAIEHLKKLATKIDKHTELLSELKISVDEAVRGLEGLNLSEAAKMEIKEIKEIMSHLALANLIAVIAHMQNFCNLTSRISETVDESKEELIEMEKLILIKTEQKGK